MAGSFQSNFDISLRMAGSFRSNFDISLRMAGSFQSNFDLPLRMAGSFQSKFTKMIIIRNFINESCTLSILELDVVKKDIIKCSIDQHPQNLLFLPL
jgi:hypothetical protein